MVEHTVLIPLRNAGSELRSQIATLRKVLNRLGREFEIICIDDRSAEPNRAILAKLLDEEPALRVLLLDKPCGLSVALGVGIAAAQGNVVVATEAGRRYPPQEIPYLISRLSWVDLVYGKRRRGPLEKLWHRLARIPRWLLLGLEVRDPDCLLWAARKEAVEGLPLARGMSRYLPWLVARRGYRVGEVYVRHQGDVSSFPSERPNPGDLLNAWWMSRRCRNPHVREMSPAEDVRQSFRFPQWASAGSKKQKAG